MCFGPIFPYIHFWITDQHQSLGNQTSIEHPCQPIMQSNSVFKCFYLQRTGQMVLELSQYLACQYSANIKYLPLQITGSKKPILGRLMNFNN